MVYLYILILIFIHNVPLNKRRLMTAEERDKTSFDKIFKENDRREMRRNTYLCTTYFV